MKVFGYQAGKAVVTYKWGSSSTSIKTLIINEVASTNRKDNSWFELYNSDTKAINLSDYTLKSHYSDGSDEGVFNFTLPSKIIPAKGYLVIRPNYGPAFNRTMPKIENNEVIYLKDSVSKKFPIWNSSSNGFLELLKSGKTVDFVTFGSNTTPTTATAWSGSFVPSFGSNQWQSIARDIHSKDTNTLSDWEVRDFPTYGGPNDVNCNIDNDKDGIPDCSEIKGSKYAGIDLYAFGARRNQKDIFIEVDYVDSTNGGTLSVDKGVVPQQKALEKVRDSFAAHGYTVHFDVGNLFSHNGTAINPTLMDLGGGNEVPYSKYINLGCTSDGIDARDYKAMNMQTQRKQIFYYMLFGTSQGTGSSGCSEILGNDSLITLGGWNLSVIENRNKLINFQAGTVMHEFGHALGLKHGGDEHQNYKPNYLSVMNYLYQLSGLATIGNNEGDRYFNVTKGCTYAIPTNPASGNPNNFKIGYSDGTRSALDEANGIMEVNGLGHINSNAVDFNCNGTSNETLSNFNLNPRVGNNISVVKDHNDWEKLNIIFARTFNGTSGTSEDENTSEPIIINPTIDDVQQVAEEFPIEQPIY